MHYVIDNIETIESNIDGVLSLYLTYRLNNTLCGICRVSHLDTEVLYIDELYVVPFYRNKHIASKLVQAVLSIATVNNCKAVTLSVDDFDRVGKFYEKLGFKKVYQYPSREGKAAMYSYLLY